MAKTEKTQEEQLKEPQAQVESMRKLKAFFITPLGGDNSDIRRSTNGLIDAVITPALEAHSIELISPHRIKNPGNITRQIVQYILDCDLVLANLTGLNANVMYELAIRHAKRKPVIVIAETGTVLPFDIAAERTFFYRNDMNGVVELLNTLVDIIPIALKDENPENPIYSGLEASIIREQVEKDSNPFETYVLEKLDDLADRLLIFNNQLAPLKTRTSIVNAPVNVSNPPPINEGRYIYFITFNQEEDVRSKDDGTNSQLENLMRYFFNMRVNVTLQQIKGLTYSLELPMKYYKAIDTLEVELRNAGIDFAALSNLPY